MRYDLLYKDYDGNLYVRTNDCVMNIRTGEVVPYSVYDKLIYLSDQQETILSYIIRNGSITSHDAYIHLNIVALTTRVSEMRAKGLPIQSTTVRYTANDGTRIRYNKYYLWEDDNEQLRFT